MDPVIRCIGLRHAYGGDTVLHGLDFTVAAGGVFALLGRNGAGKSTTINILMGFLAPSAGTAEVLGHPAHALPPATRARIGLLHEGFVAYDFMTIAEIERFHAPLYPRWERAVYWDLVGRLGVPANRRVAHLSCGQRSQVVLGLILAQNPRLMILDDYSMGLDVGYRRLFLDYLRDHVKRRGTTVLLTSHVVQELDGIVDHLVILDRGRVVAAGPKAEFMAGFHQFRLPATAEPAPAITAAGPVAAVWNGPDGVELYAHHPLDVVATHLRAQGVDPTGLHPVPMSLEDAFVGLTGRY